MTDLKQAMDCVDKTFMIDTLGTLADEPTISQQLQDILTRHTEVYQTEKTRLENEIADRLARVADIDLALSAMGAALEKLTMDGAIERARATPTGDPEIFGGGGDPTIEPEVEPPLGSIEHDYSVSERFKAAGDDGLAQEKVLEQVHQTRKARSKSIDPKK